MNHLLSSIKTSTALRRSFAGLTFALIFLGSLKAADLLLGWTHTRGLNEEGIKRSILFKEHPPNLSQLVRPNPHELADTDGLEAREVAFKTDKDGFIAGSSEPTGPIDIVFMGGSTVECLYVDEGNRFPALTSLLLRRSDGSATNTKNAGVGGSHSVHSMLSLHAKVLPLKPRIVVIMHNANDLFLLMHTGSYWKAPEKRSIVQVATHSTIRTIAKSAKDMLIPNIYALMRMVDRTRIYKDEFEGFRATAVSNADITKDFRSSLTAIVSVLRAWGIEPVLMTQFNRNDYSDGFIKAQFEKVTQPWTWVEFVRHYKHFNDVVRQVSAETRTFLIDLDAEVPHSKDYIYDALHLNDEGSKLVARIVSRELAGRFSEYRLGALKGSQ